MLARSILAQAGRDKILVAYSGGKDSLVVLDLCCRMFKKVECFFLYFVDGMECCEKWLRFAEQKYGVKVHKLPHPNLARALKYAQYTVDFDGNRKIKALTLPDIEAIIRKRAGNDWIVYGYKMTDSMHRRGWLRKNRGIYRAGRHVFPLATWNDDDVRHYLQVRQLPIPESFAGLRSSGISLEPRVLAWIKTKYPNDYEKIKRVFTFVDAAVMKHEQIVGAKSQPASAV